jgi:dynein heavy chain
MRHMGTVHNTVRDICDDYYAMMRRRNYVTPKSYLSYLTAYSGLYVKKYQELDKTEKNFSVGVRKID